MKPLRFSIRVLSCVCLTIFLLSEISVFAAPQANPVSGPEVYQKRCASCHDQVGSRVPTRETLQKMPAKRILRALDFGLMMGVAGPMKREEREAVASFLGTGAAEATPLASAFCAAGSQVMSGPAKGNWNGWSPDASNTRYQTADQAGLTSGQVRHLKLKWAYGFSGDITSFAAPTVLEGTLFMGSAGGRVQAVNARTGCLYWVFDADGPVRSAIRAVRNGTSYSLIFTDRNGGVYSLERKTGRLLWKRRVKDHEATRLTGSPVALNSVVYIPAASWEETRSADPQYQCCTFRGSLTALRVRDGSVVWKSYMIDPPRKTGVNSAGTPEWAPSGAGIWSAPTVDTKRGVLYVTTGDNYSLPWPARPAMRLLRLTSRRDASHGHGRCSPAMPGRPPASAEAQWPPVTGRTTTSDLRSCYCTWQTVVDILAAGQNPASSTLWTRTKGKILWQTRVGKNGIQAKGGSVDGAGPVVVDGMVYFNSGYPRFGGMPGNVLLAFGPGNQAVQIGTSSCEGEGLFLEHVYRVPMRRPLAWA